MLVSTLITILSNILKDKGDIKVYVANDRGGVNLVTGIPQVIKMHIIPDRLAVVSEEQLRNTIQETFIVIARG